MTKRMLVDAAYPEETRVVVLDADQLIEFDYETTAKQQLKGNIYLAKVTRVEPSLQAAFVEYGGNRHGFLAFSEIHPDYYQIPQADRDRLNEIEQQIAASGEPAEEADEEEVGNRREAETAEFEGEDEQETGADVVKLRRERARMLRQYKIQEVVKRRQILLVQVMKEERGTKGAALTTYLSLAGRYCVLMPNTPRGGGISRKISTQSDRTRLKDIAQDLNVPMGMGLIIRTAGQERTKAEIRRDYDYLLRLWEDIRTRTLESIAPCGIHEEATLIKRAMRDLYTSDIEEVLVEGESGYRTAKQFMTMLMPSRARRVKQYKETIPLFAANRVEDLLDLMHDPMVRLRSGGSIVINPTEALTAIDVNSGRSTRERHIDETAVKTNLEAAEEIARQMRLRDIAGLVVIDFIDMAEHRHQRQVEKRLRDALKADRARLQVGRISSFGLLELSRQRLRPSFLELSSQTCPLCQGSGVVRSTEGAALQAMRKVEAVGLEGKASAVALKLPLEVALYLINQKRMDLIRLEQRYSLQVEVRVDEALIGGQTAIDILATDRDEVEEAPVAEAKPESREPKDEGKAAAAEPEAGEETAEDGGRKRRRRRRRRRREEDADARPMAAADEADGDEREVVEEGEAPAAPAEAQDTEEAEAESPPPRRRRRRRTRPAAEEDAQAEEQAPLPVEAGAEESPDQPDATPAEFDVPPLVLPEPDVPVFVAEATADAFPVTPAEDSTPAPTEAVAEAEAPSEVTAADLPPVDAVANDQSPAEEPALVGEQDQAERVEAEEPTHQVPAGEPFEVVPQLALHAAANGTAQSEPAHAAASEQAPPSEHEGVAVSEPEAIVDVPVDERPGVVVDTGAEKPETSRREGWWSRLTRRS